VARERNAVNATSGRATGRSPLGVVLGGCALLAVCGLALVAVGSGLWWLAQRGADTSQPTVEYVVDASTRMALPAEGGGSSTRLGVARAVLAEIVRPAAANVTAGLRSFGVSDLAADVCQDSNLLVPLGPANQGLIADQLLALDHGASAEAPLAEAMVQAIRDLGTTSGPHTLVVVTGGADSCQPEAGLLIAREAESAGIELEYFVIGFQVLPADGVALKGMVDSMPSAHYLPALDRDQLRAILLAIQARIDAPGTQSVTDVLATAQALSTAQATPTITAGETPTPQPLTPPATAAGSGTPEATDAANSAPQSACDHPYLPLRPGATWTYVGATGDSLLLTVTGVAGGQDNATATLTRLVNGLNDVSTVTCGPDGIRSDSPTGDIVGLSWTLSFGPGWERTEATGVWLPPADELAPGASWSSHSAFANAEGRAAARDQTHVVGGFESVLLDGQTVEALRVDVTLGYGPDQDVAGSASEWFVRGVGLVKWEGTVTTSGVTASSTWVLQTYSVP
jgi:hypothetical protein